MRYNDLGPTLLLLDTINEQAIEMRTAIQVSSGLVASRHVRRSYGRRRAGTPVS